MWSSFIHVDHVSRFKNCPFGSWSSARVTIRVGDWKKSQLKCCFESFTLLLHYSCLYFFLVSLQSQLHYFQLLMSNILKVICRLNNFLIATQVCCFCFRDSRPKISSACISCMQFFTCMLIPVYSSWVCPCRKKILATRLVRPIDRFHIEYKRIHRPIKIFGNYARR